MRRRQAMAGFSLVETLVGLAILSGVLIVAYSSLSGALSAVMRVIARGQAVSAVEEQVAQIMAHGVGTGSHAFSGRAGTYSWSVSLEALPFPHPASGAAVAPVRVHGQIRLIDSPAEAETVFDSVLLAAAR